MALETITADSKPIYCIFGGSDCWTCDDLVQWHKLMSVKYGKVEANLRFLNSWENDTPFINKQADCRSFNSTFRAYMKDVGLLPSLFSGIGVIAQPIGFVTDTVGTGSDILVNTLKVLKFVIPAIVIIIAIGGLVWVYKKSNLRLA